MYIPFNSCSNNLKIIALKNPKMGLARTPLFRETTFCKSSTKYVQNSHNHNASSDHIIFIWFWAKLEFPFRPHQTSIYKVKSSYVLYSNVVCMKHPILAHFQFYLLYFEFQCGKLATSCFEITLCFWLTYCF